MAGTTKVVRSHRQTQVILGNDDYRSEGSPSGAGGPSSASASKADAEQPVAAHEPMALPERLWRDRQYRRDRSLRRRYARKRLRIVGRAAYGRPPRPDASAGRQPGAQNPGKKQQSKSAARIASLAQRAAQDEAWDALSASMGAVPAADDCTAPIRIHVRLPAPIPAGMEAHFWMAYDEAAFQLPPRATQAQRNACAAQAWRECFVEHFGEPAAYTSRQKIWAMAPDWCWQDSAFTKAFFAEFEGAPYTSETCTDAQLAAALLAAWDASQGDNWQ